MREAEEQAIWKSEAQAAVDSIPDAFRRLADVQLAALRAYQPQPYPGAATLYRVGEEDESRGDDPTRGWGRLVGGRLDMKTIAGVHLTVWENQYVGALAAQLRDDLQRSQHEDAPRQGKAGDGRLPGPGRSSASPGAPERTDG
jgi:hypothetical protein